MKPDKITVHCSVTPNLKPVSVHALRRQHTKPVEEGGRGFKDIGYHYLIQPDGTVDKGRPIEQTGAHVEGHNQGNVGICLIGTDSFSEDQLDALRKLVRALCTRFSIPLHEIYCHHEFDTAKRQGKTCPNLPIKPLLVYLMTGDLAALECLQKPSH